jgi:HAD superfamily phosphatase
LSFAVAPPHLHRQPEARATYEARLREAGADVVIPSTANLLESLLPQLG